MKYFALFYDVVDDFTTQRIPFRETHLQLIDEAHQRGEIVLAGAFSEPTDRVLYIFRVPERAVVEAFAHNDPYVLHGLVTKWEIRVWSVIIGG